MVKPTWWTTPVPVNVTKSVSGTLRVDVLNGLPLNTSGGLLSVVVKYVPKLEGGSTGEALTRVVIVLPCM